MLALFECVQNNIINLYSQKRIEKNIENVVSKLCQARLDFSICTIGNQLYYGKIMPISIEPGNTDLGKWDLFNYNIAVDIKSQSIKSDIDWKWRIRAREHKFPNAIQEICLFRIIVVFRNQPCLQYHSTNFKVSMIERRILHYLIEYQWEMVLALMKIT